MESGTRLGPYEILEPLGHGGMGEVYKAFDARLGRHVAIKTVAAARLADPEMRARFDREARAIAKLSHPNILAIHDVGSHDGIPYIAVELLDGETLRSRMGSPLPAAAAVNFAVQIGRGLAAAHERNIIHRDLKPDNVFVTRDGQVKLIDFGLSRKPVDARATDTTDVVVTGAGVTLGTAPYMSPEQVRGEDLDARSDIFSFGCVLYEMLAGKRAFTRGTQIETLHAVVKEHPADLVTLRPDLPSSLVRLVRRCLEKSPAGRFQTSRDLVFALEEAAGGTTTAPPRRGSLVAVVAAVALLAVGGAAWWIVSRRPAEEPPAAPAVASEARSRVVAVLPFENISGGDEGYFAQGMTQEVRSQLSKLSGLRVVGSGAVAQFKDPRNQLAAMATDLGVGAVVTGTVREQGTRVRVSVELIDARSAHVLWSEQYDREGVDVFAAQSDIALQVGRALNASVTLDEQARIGKRPTSSIAAYELFRRAMNASGKTPEETLKARSELLREAVAADPQFAAAYGEMANAFYFLGTYGDPSALTRGIDAANRAIQIDPALAPGHRGLALNLQQQGRLGDALSSYRKAVDLDPSYTGGLNDFAFGLSTAGRYDEALRYSKRALDLTANTPGSYYHVGVALLGLDDDARTERFLTTAAARFPTASRLQTLLVFLDLRRGQPRAAEERIRAAADKTPNNIETLLTRAEIETFAGAREAADHVAELMARAADGMLHNAPYPVKLAHAYHLHRSGAKDDAGRILDTILTTNRRAIADGADWPMVFVQNAAVAALRGQAATALDELERGYAAGWRDGRTLAIDPFFATIRTEPRFVQLLSRIQSDVAAMRARADYAGLP
jgi:TolB-like protein/Tfp pilus assembly protein PilF/tRNA A-37 threonylcarbamoyl transferase component Bud32